MSKPHNPSSHRNVRRRYVSVISAMDYRRAHLEATKGEIRVSRFNKSSTIIRIRREKSNYCA